MSTPRQERRASCTLCGNSLFVKDWPNPRAVRCPMLLTCGHTACRQCLESYANLNQQVTCRQCNTVVVLSSRTDVDKVFPVNYYVLGKMLYTEAVQKQSHSRSSRSSVTYIPAGASLAPSHSRPALAVRPLSHTPNTVCFECSVHDAVYRCEQCDAVYCHGCFAKVHSSGKALRAHTRINLTDEPANAFMLGPCVTHPEVNYRFYCEEDTVLVCPLCAVLNHNGHTLLEMSAKNTTLLPQVQEATLALMKVSKELERSRKGLRQLSPGAESEQLIQMRHEVATHFSSLHGFLQMHEERLALQLNVGKISCYDDIETMTQEVGDQVRNMQKLLKMAQTALEPDMLTKMDFIKLMSELRDAVSLPCKLTLPNTKVLDVKFEIVTNVLPILENHCTLNITAPPPPMLMSLLPEEMEKLDESETSEDSEVTSALAANNNNPFIAALERKQTSPLVSISHNNNTKNSPHSSQSLPSPHSSVSSDSPASPRRVVVASKQNKPADWSVGTSELIRLSHVINPSNFYVQRVVDDPKLEQLLRDLELVAPTCKPFNIPKIGNLCIVQYSRDGRWYRGRIKSIIAGSGTESLCDVFYIDYGNMEQVPLHRVLELPKHLCEFQPLCRHCVLNGIVANYVEWSDEATRVFVEITTRPKLQLTVAGFSGNSLKVDLIILSNDLAGSSYEPTSVRDILLFLDHGCLIAGETSSSLAKVMKPTRKFASSHFNLTAGSSLQVIVTHIDSPMSFYIQKVDKHAEGLGNMMRALNEHYRTPDKKYNVYYPQIGMCCVAKYEEDGNWYRAIVTGLPDKKMVSVQYVDYGNSEVVSWENVKKLHEKFFLIDAQAVKCQLYDLKLPGDTKVWDEEACIKFHALCYNKKLRMVVNARNNMDLTVSLYERVGKEEHSVAVAMAQAGFGMCSRKSAQATVQKRANTGTHKDPHSFMGPQPPRNKVGRGNYTPYMEVQPCLRPDPSSPVAASLAPSMLQLQTRQPSQPREPELRKEVQVISHNSPGEIYIRISSLVPQLERMIDAMQTYFKNPPVEVEEKEWRKDEYCAVKRHIHPQWCRAVVISEKLSEYIAKVFLIDHAMEMDVCMADLYALPEEFARLLHGAIRCHMTGIKAAGDSNKWPILARERLGDLLVQYDAVFMTKTGPIVDNSIPVELWVEEVVESGALEPIVKRWACLNQMLVERGVAIPVRSEEALPVVPDSNQMLEELIKYTQDRYNVPCTSADVPQRSVTFVPAAEPKKKSLQEEPMVVDITEDSEDAPVIITEEKPKFYAQWVEPELPKRLTFTALATYVDYSGYFYLQELPKSEKALAKLQRMVDHHYRDSVPAPEDMLWSVGQICVAKYHVDNKWYRAKVIEILDADCNHLRVQFVDFGNTETVSVIDLRKAAFVTSVPVQCIKCKFHGLIPLAKDNEWTTFDLDIIHGSIVDKKCAVVLAELPSPGQVVKVCGLVTDLGRDIFKFLVEQEIAERGLVASSPTLSEVSDSESIFSEQEEPMQVSIESMQTDTAPPHSASSTNSQEEEETENEGMQVVENKTETIQHNETEPEHNSDVNMKDGQSETAQGLPETVQDRDTVEKEQGGELAETAQEVNVPEKEQDKDMTETDQDGNVTEMGKNTEQVAAAEEEEAICVILSVESTGPEEEEEEQTRVKTESDNTEKSDTKETQVVCISSDDDNCSNDSVSIYKYKLDPRGKFVPLSFEENSLMLVDITVVVSAVEIYIKPASLEDLDPLNTLMEEITREASKLPPLNAIEIGQACCAQYMSQFFRVLVVNINPDCLTAVVNFVDYGNNEELPLSDLRAMRDSWMQLPRQALHCMVTDVEILPDVDENMLDTETSAALLSGQVYAKILSKEEPCKVQLLKQDQTTSVYEEMVEKKLVKMTES